MVIMNKSENIFFYFCFIDKIIFGHYFALACLECTPPPRLNLKPTSRLNVLQSYGKPLCQASGRVSVIM